MSRKKKKNRKREAHQAVRDASAQDLFIQGQELLEAGKPRDAIASLKAAAKKGWPEKETTHLLFKAYSLRAIQLEQKGMSAEAAAVQQHAGALMPSSADLSEDDLLAFIRTCDIPRAVDAYEGFLKARKQSEKIEYLLAGRLMIDPRFDAVDKRLESTPLARHAPLIREAMDLMNAGKWELAMAVLNPVPRVSPWAPLRLLCHAMVCFYREDDPGMARALEMIPEDHPLNPLVQKLCPDPRGIACLWDGPVDMNVHITGILKAIEQNQFQRAGGHIRRVAEILLPDNPKSAIFHLMELLHALILRDKIYDHTYFSMAARILPPAENDALKAKTQWLWLSTRPFEAARRYLQCLDIEFPDKTEQMTVAAWVILLAVNRHETSRNDAYNHNIMDGLELKNHLGLRPGGPDTLIEDLLLYAVSLDPENLEIYQKLASRVHDFTPKNAKPLIEKGLEKMRAQFPDDPFPCLELAKLYYTKNAYRKAEQALEDAAALAPHDNRVAKMRMLSLLISAKRSIYRGSLEKAQLDLETAEALAEPSDMFLIAAIQIQLDFLNSGQTAFSQKRLERDQADARRVLMPLMNPAIPLFHRLRTLGALYADVSSYQRNAIWTPKMLNEVEHAIEKNLQSIDALTPAEVCLLLMPIHLDLPAISKTTLAMIFIARHPKMLCRIDDEQFLPVVDHLIDCRLYSPVLSELHRRKKRIKKTDKKFYSLLAFYEVTVRHMEKKDFVGFDEFIEVIENSDPKDEPMLRDAARRLSRFADDNYLKEALEHFNFFPSDPMNLWDDEDNWDDQDEWDDDVFNENDFAPPLFEEDMNALIATLEHLLIMMRLKGAPKKTILSFRKELLNGPLPFPHEELKHFLETESSVAISRELRLLLYGENG